MKLVNPAGRNVTTFSTEVNRCACMCYNSWNSAFNGADDYTCSCNCQSGNTNNMNSNWNSAYIV
jgi:hypothetical protein